MKNLYPKLIFYYFKPHFQKQTRDVKEKSKKKKKSWHAKELYYLYFTVLLHLFGLNHCCLKTFLFISLTISYHAYNSTKILLLVKNNANWRKIISSGPSRFLIIAFNRFWHCIVDDEALKAWQMKIWVTKSVNLRYQ